MKSIAFVFACLFICIFIACNQQTSTNSQSIAVKDDTCLQKVNDAQWLVLNNNGQGNNPTHFALKMAHAVLEYYFENIKIIDRYSVEIDNDFPKHFSNDSLKVDSIGLWGNYAVFQVSNYLVMHRSVLLKDCRGVFRILYTEFDHVGSPLSGVQVFAENAAAGSAALNIEEINKEMLPTIQNNQLDIKAFVGGNKDYYEHYRFSISDSAQIPVLVP